MGFLDILAFAASLAKPESYRLPTTAKKVTNDLLNKNNAIIDDIELVGSTTSE